MLDPSREYDVIIVGAGPAGLASAKSCVEHGLKTLVIEEHAAIGTPVQCGEAFHFKMLLKLGLENKVDANELRHAKIYSPNRKVIAITLQEGVNSPIRIVERKQLEKKLAVTIANLGVELFTKTRAIDVLQENGWVRGIKALRFGAQVNLKSKIVIDASGPGAVIASKAGLVVYRNVELFDSCAQFQLAGVDIDPKTAEIFLGEVAPGGFVWILPKAKGFANVGLGVNGNFGKYALSLLEDFIEKDARLRNGSIIEVNAGIVPLGGAAEKLVANGLMLVGDAARQVNPATGGGMIFAIKAGLAAGKIAAEAIKSNDCSEKFLAHYEKIWKNAIGKRFKAFLTLKDVFLTLSDKELDELAEAVGTISIDKELDEPWYPILKKIITIIVKKPKVALKFRKVLLDFV